MSLFKLVEHNVIVASRKTSVRLRLHETVDMHFESTEKAAALRDLAIECMSRLNSTAIAVKSHGSQEYWVEYRRVVGRVMGEIGSAINAVVQDVPALEPSEEEWARIATSRVPVEEACAIEAASNAAALAPHLAEIEVRLDRLAEMLGSKGHPWVRPGWRWPELARVAGLSWTSKPAGTP